MEDKLLLEVHDLNQWQCPAMPPRRVPVAVKPKLREKLRRIERFEVLKKCIFSRYTLLCSAVSGVRYLQLALLFAL